MSPPSFEKGSRLGTLFCFGGKLKYRNDKVFLKFFYPNSE